MKLINANKYKKDIEHYRNTICYQRNVTMDDCMRILDKQEDVLDDAIKEAQAFLDEGDVREFEGNMRSGHHVFDIFIKHIGKE